MATKIVGLANDTMDRHASRLPGMQCYGAALRRGYVQLVPDEVASYLVGIGYARLYSESEPFNDHVGGLEDRSQDPTEHAAWGVTP